MDIMSYKNKWVFTCENVAYGSNQHHLFTIGGHTCIRRVFVPKCLSANHTSLTLQPNDFLKLELLLFSTWKRIISKSQLANRAFQNSDMRMQSCRSTRCVKAEQWINQCKCSIDDVWIVWFVVTVSQQLYIQSVQTPDYQCCWVSLWLIVLERLSKLH